MFLLLCYVLCFNVVKLQCRYPHKLVDGRKGVVYKCLKKILERSTQIMFQSKTCQNIIFYITVNTWPKLILLLDCWYI